MLQDGGRAMMMDKEEIQRVVSSCNDFAEAEKRSKHPCYLLWLIVNSNYCSLENHICCDRPASCTFLL